MSIIKELSQREFIQNENNIRHSAYEKEYAFYSAVKAGDIDLVKKLYTPLGATGHGLLSTNEIRNLKYHLIITVAMISRFCVEGGVPLERAYTASDIFINKLDTLNTTDEIIKLHKDIIYYYTMEAKKAAAKNAYSKNVLMCIDYVYDNIYSGVTVNQAASNLGLTPQYLSKLFKQEVGINLSDFIMEKRIIAASNMLKYSDFSPLDIGNYLSFSSHSHFISVFKKHTGMTPRQYREEYFRMNWAKNED